MAWTVIGVDPAPLHIGVWEQSGGRSDRAKRGLGGVEEPIEGSEALPLPAGCIIKRGSAVEP